MQSDWDQITKHCPFPDCDWKRDLYQDRNGEIVDDMPAVLHYEKEHAGKVRVQVTVEYEQLLAGRTTEQVREAALERFENDGHDVAFVRTEVLQEADDHSVLEGDEVRGSGGEP